MDTERSAGEWSQAVRQQAALAHLGQVGLQSSDLDAVLAEALVVVADTLGVADVALHEWRADRDGLGAVAALVDGAPVAGGGGDDAGGPAGVGPLAQRALGSPVPVVDGAAVATAIGWGLDDHGVLVVCGDHGRTWSDDELHFVRSVGNTVGLAVQRQAVERQLRDSTARLDLSLSAGGLGAWSWDVDANRVDLNDRALAIFGLTPDAFEGRAEQFLALVHPDDRNQVAADVLGGAERGEQHQLYRIIRRDDGQVRWVESWGRELVDGQPGRRLVGISSDVTERRQFDEQREELLGRERSARVAAEAARERLAFLAGAARALTTSLDPTEILERLVDLCVPGLADACVVDLRGEGERQVERAGRAVDPALLATVRSATPGRLPPDEPAEGPRAQLVVRDADGSEPGRGTISAPLVARGRALGVLTLVRVGGERPFVDEDVAFAAELAGRAALAADNARLYRSRNRVARSLQAALLPPALPDVEGLALAARYDVAEADVAIGGDFYDVVAVRPGAWGVVIGDVCGRGPDAAALTGLVRHSLRTALVSKRRPSEVLARTNEAVLRQIDDASFCTAAYLDVTVHAAAGTVEVVAASAGHPCPVVVRADGEAWPMDCAGTLLGVMEDPVLRDSSVTLGPGDAVVLYTDGLTEARRGAELFGRERLMGALRAVAGADAQTMARALDDEVESFRRSVRDDTAILVVQAPARP